MTYDYAIIGGDKRSAYMAAILIEQGFQVITYGLDTTDISEDTEIADTLDTAVSSARTIIAPIPLTRDGSQITAKEALPDMSLEHLKKGLTGNHLFFAGCIPADYFKGKTDQPALVYDYMEDEELTIFNTIATAEGAIAEAVISKPVNLHDSSVLVIGYGRCARTLADKLRGLSADVTVCARKTEARSEARRAGCKTLDFQQITGKLKEFDFIFNTVPSLVLDANALSQVGKDVLIIDIASAPGGVDFAYADSHKIKAVLSLGLPGKYAAASSARALADVTLSMTKE